MASNTCRYAILVPLPAPQPTSSFTNYETHSRYSTQPHYTTYSSRGTPPIPGHQPDSRKLPPLATNTDPQWQTSPYIPASSNYNVGGGIRSPTASYPTAYAGYPTSNQPSYTYQMPAQEHRMVPSMNPQTHMSVYGTDSSHVDIHRNPSPYSRGSSHVSPPTYTPPPVSPTSPDESTIKKKRKRADAAQLKVLNETYNRTAFPSTEERLALAKALDMSARSVQIW
jgi:homeobox protein YOX1/YHP1